MPFAAGEFDGAYMLHVGMNIENKAGAFAEVRRVIKPGGVFGIYDVMRADHDGDLPFPLPWASSPETSFVESPEAYRRLLEDAGFSVERQRDRREFGLEFFRQVRARAQQGGAPPVGAFITMAVPPRRRLRIRSTVWREDSSRRRRSSAEPCNPSCARWDATRTRPAGSNSRRRSSAGPEVDA